MSGNSFNRPGISDEFLQAAGVEFGDTPDVHLRIPYHDRHGQRTGHYRDRLKAIRPDGQKYDQPAGSGIHVYFSHIPFWADSRVFITEGEFKALSMLEAGYPAIGLPGLHCYTNDTLGQPQILPALYEAVRFAALEEIVFIGDSDTWLNLEYYRSGHFLAVAFPNHHVSLVQIPFGGNVKGVDDLHGASNGEFPDCLTILCNKGLWVDPNESFLLPATLQLSGIKKLIDAAPVEKQLFYRRKICQMAAMAKRAQEQPEASIAQFLQAAKEASRFNKVTFNSILKDELNEITGEEASKEADRKNAYYNGLKPWPVERPLVEILVEAREITSQFVITDPHNFLLSSCWAAHTSAFPYSAYLPLLLFTGPTEDTGKSTYMRVVGRMSYRAFLLIATLSIHRVLSKYQGTFLLDESKRLAENKDLISFVNSGFDNISDHPVDTPLLSRYDMDSKQLLDFDPRFPKMMAGIGTFLERDTLSRSIVIPMERYLLAESRRVKDYVFCTNAITEPIYRAFLTYWTEARQVLFRQKCLEVIPKFPPEFRSRNRLKFVPIMAVADLAGEAMFDEVLAACQWKLNASVKSDQDTNHRMLCDVARCLYRQMALHYLAVNDPRTGQPSLLVKEPDRDFFILETKVLVLLLKQLPEAPWNCYEYKNRKDKILDDNTLWDILDEFGLEAVQKRIKGRTHRGLVYQTFHEKYQRYARVGDPTLASAIAELEKEWDDPNDPDGNVSNPRPKPEPTDPGISSKKPETTRASQETPKSAGTAGTANVSPSATSTKPVPALSKEDQTNLGCRDYEVVDFEVLNLPVPAIPALLGVFGDARVFIPPSTPQAPFCTAAQPERLLCVDIETFGLYGPEYPQPASFTAGQLVTRQREGKAHPYASDPRRCVIRLLTIWDPAGSFGPIPLTFDLAVTSELPAEFLKALAEWTLVGHSLDFDLTVLRRYGILISNSIIDTMIASRLLGLGKQKLSFDPNVYSELSLDEIEEMEAEAENDPNPIAHDLAATMLRYLGIQMDKATTKLGASDWGQKNLSAEQLAYATEDVALLFRLWEALKSQLEKANLDVVFAARMVFAVHLNQIKMTGIPTDTERLTQADLPRATTEKEKSGEELTQIFSELTFEIPKSWKKKVKIKREGEKTKWIAGPTHEGFRPSNRNQHWLIALASRGIHLENTQAPTLRRVDKPECWALLKYAAAAKRLSEIVGISRSIFPDGRVRAETWNQLAAVTGRIISRGPNLQQIPNEYRGPFRVKEPWLWLKGDLEQIEMLILAVVTKDPNLLGMLLAGKDAYVEYGARIFHRKPERGPGDDQVTELLRKVAKIPTLGTSYGMTPYGFVRQLRDELGLEYSIEQAKEFFEVFFEMFSGISAYHTRAEEEAVYRIDVRTIAGTRRWLPPLTGEPSDDWELNKEFERSLRYRKNVLLNTPIQGSGADLVIWAVNQFIPQLPAEVEVINLVHDEVDVLVTKETLVPTVELITKAFQEVFAKFYPESPLAPKIKFSVGPSWGELQPI